MDWTVLPVSGEVLIFVAKPEGPESTQERLTPGGSDEPVVDGGWCRDLSIFRG